MCWSFLGAAFNWRSVGNMDNKSQELPKLVTICTAIVIVTIADNVSGHHGLILCSSGPCGPGHHLTEKDLCVPCPEGTYMPKHDHRCHSCKRCTKPRVQHNEIATKNCTATNDTEIACKSGYYMQGFSYGSKCHHCTECTNNTTEASPCWGRNNRICFSGNVSSTGTDIQASLEDKPGNCTKGCTQSEIPINETMNGHVDRKKGVSAIKDIYHFQNKNDNNNVLVVGVISGASIAAALLSFIVIYNCAELRDRVPTDDYFDD